MAQQAERQSFTSNDYRYAIAKDEAVKTAHKLARIWETNTVLADLPDAQALADSDLLLHKSLRRLYRVQLSKSRKIEPGSTIRLTHPLFPSGKSFFVVSVVSRVSGTNTTTELRVWG